MLDLYYAPPALTNSRDATFAFTSTKAGARFECRLDGSAWATCTTMHRLAGVADGLRRFEVRSIVGARVEPEPAAYEWTVDATAPVVRIEAPADGTQTDDHTPRIGGTAGTAVGDRPEVCVTVYGWNGENRAACAPVTDGRWSLDVEPALPDGAYSVEAHQEDDATNSGGSRQHELLIGAAASPTAPGGPVEPEGPPVPEPSPTPYPRPGGDPPDPDPDGRRRPRRRRSARRPSSLRRRSMTRRNRPAPAHRAPSRRPWPRTCANTACGVRRRFRYAATRRGHLRVRVRAGGTLLARSTVTFRRATTRAFTLRRTSAARHGRRRMRIEVEFAARGERRVRSVRTASLPR